MSSLRQSIHEATLSSKRRIESQSVSTHREDLFKTANKASASIAAKSGATRYATGLSPSETFLMFHSSKEDELMTATASVTDGLRRTRQLMEQELEKSSLSAQMLGGCSSLIGSRFWTDFRISRREVITDSDPDHRPVYIVQWFTAVLEAANHGAGEG